MSKTAQHTIAARERHHDALRSMLPPGSDLTGLQVWRKLVRIERQAHSFAERLCNGESLSLTEAEQDSIIQAFTDSVATVFGGKVPPGFFINLDPRGYALKLKPDSVPYRLHQDWGGYQILAPMID